ncbi:MAG: protein-export chaperone SecB [Prevotellaceae bacterium]|jgi:preprotein translocase subunit SecB|nr:protein-export chaperone SecB [Prevotellaceae bacterium]
MTKIVKTAEFRLKKYKVIRSNIELKSNELPDHEFSIEINPSGEKQNKYFHLKLDVSIKDKKDVYNVFVSILGEFEFKEDINDITDYFLINAPAILFPYVRAYVSSLTSISGITTVIIPTLNLTALKDKLSKNITERE